MIFFQQLLNGVVVGATYGLFALGFTLIFGVLHVLNLAHGAVFMWGAMVGLFAVTVLDLPLPIVFALAVLASGLISVAVDFLAFCPLRRRGNPEFSAIVTSIRLSQILMSLAQFASETQIHRFPFGTFPIKFYSFAGMRISLQQYRHPNIRLRAGRRISFPAQASDVKSAPLPCPIRHRSFSA